MTPEAALEPVATGQPGPEKPGWALGPAEAWTQDVCFLQS